MGWEPDLWTFSPTPSPLHTHTLQIYVLPVVGWWKRQDRNNKSVDHLNAEEKRWIFSFDLKEVWRGMADKEVLLQSTKIIFKNHSCWWPLFIMYNALDKDAQCCTTGVTKHVVNPKVDSQWSHSVSNCVSQNNYVHWKPLWFTWWFFLPLLILCAVTLYNNDKH